MTFMIVTIFVFILILSVLVLIHEAGHFFVAKKLGVKVEEFGFGFPPRIFGKKIGETIYSINALPIGGFVKLYGEDEAGAGKIQVASKTKKELKNSKNIKRAFFSKNPWQRAAIVIAGVVMNFLLAVAISSYLYAVVGIATAGNHVVIEGVAKNSPAEKSGMHIGDTIISVNSVAIVSPQQVIAFTKKHLGEKLSIVISNEQNQKRVLFVTPRVMYSPTEGAMGIAITTNVSVKKYPWYQAPFVGTVEAIKQSWMIIVGLGQAVGQLVIQHAVPKDVAGPIGIAQLTGRFVQVGPNAVLSLISLLSLNLAVLNILPIPALDGGRLFFILFEAFTGRKVNQRFEGYAHAIGMAFLMVLILLITFHDIFRLITHQPLIP